MTLKIYAVWVSQNADCSAAVLVSDFGAGGQDVSLGVNPLIQASPANGTYQCMIMKMSDNLRFIPDAEAISDHAGCSADTEAIFDIYRTDSGDTDTWKDMDGNTITASGAGTTPGDDTVYIYATTDAAAVQSGAIGANVNQTATLTGALVVPGQTTFYADFTDGVTSDSGVCKIEGGTGLGFR